MPVNEVVSFKANLIKLDLAFVLGKMTVLCLAELHVVSHGVNYQLIINHYEIYLFFFIAV